MAGNEALMYSQFCCYIQQDEHRRHATMHISRKPGEQIELDWPGAPAYIVDPDTGEVTKVFLFVGVMSYSQHLRLTGYTMKWRSITAVPLCRPECAPLRTSQMRKVR